MTSEVESSEIKFFLKYDAFDNQKPPMGSHTFVIWWESEGLHILVVLWLVVISKIQGDENFPFCLDRKSNLFQNKSRRR